VDSFLPQKLLQKGLVWLKSRHWARNSISPRYALVEAALIGVFGALAALLLKQGIGWLGGMRINLVNQWGAIAVLPLSGLFFGALAGLLLEYVAPTAGGGGVAQVKASLARYAVPLSLKIALVKIIGTILVLGGGLTLGRRSPTVHIGAALAAELTRLVPTSPEHRRQIIAAGAAAGLAAGFNTPIAGVMFVIEELMRDVSNLTLETAIVASFTGAVVSIILQSPDLNLPSSLLPADSISFSPQDIPLYLILGIMGGLLGALFNKGVLKSVKFNQQLKMPLWQKIGLTGLVCGSAIALLPPYFRDNAGLREFLVKGELPWEQIALVLGAHFILTIIAAGSGAPGGLFAPALIMGSSLGYLVADMGSIWINIDARATFALAGMGAFFTGVVRVPVTAIVMIFELNANFNLVLPLMITCAVSYISAEALQKGSMDQLLLHHMGYDLNDENHNDSSRQKDFLRELKAGTVMQTNVETVSPRLKVIDLLDLMSLSSHRGFPVVDNGKLVGIVTQSDLVKVRNPSSLLLTKEIMTPNPISVPPDAYLSDVLYLLNRYTLSRLPVVQEGRLVGIITRTDIIRVEVDELKADVAIKTQVAYTVYQSRSPATGRGSILVPVTSEDDYESLAKIAVAIALYNDYEIEFIKVLKIAKHLDPHSTYVDTENARELMLTLEEIGKKSNIPIHTRIVITHHRTGLLLEIIKREYIDLLVMGWGKNSSSQEFIFSHLVDNLITQAPCELILIKLGNNHSYPHNLMARGSCLVPMAGGPNAREGLKLLPAFLNVYHKGSLPPVWLAKVSPPSEKKVDSSDLYFAVEELQPHVETMVKPLSIASHSVVDGIRLIAHNQRAELVIIGASRDSLLKQTIHGNIPDAIASKLDTTVILIRLPS